MITINIKLPTSWADLSDKQLLLVFRLMMDEISETALATYCLLRWNRMEVLYASKPGESGGEAVLRRGRERYLLTALQMAEAVRSLDWLTQFPAQPVRLSHYRKAAALSADFSGVPFETFLICDNLYQGYLQTRKGELLREMGGMMYPGVSLRGKKRAAEPFLINVFYWFTSLKQFYAREFPHFFRPASQDSLGTPLPSRQQLQNAMNTQIRALTKGDITKEKEVLAMDTLRALTELDAQAKEYEELHAKSKK